MDVVAEILVRLCLLGLAACGVCLFAVKVVAPGWDAIRRHLPKSRIQQFILAVFFLNFYYYGSTKQGWHISYDGGIRQGVSPSYVTNDTVVITWQRDPALPYPLPDEAAVYIDYRPNTATNEEWGLLAQSTVGSGGWTGTVQDATNFDYNVWAYYIPPEPVHTNGVWIYKTLRDRAEKYPIPLRARIEVNGKAIATPKEKRKDEENDD